MMTEIDRSGILTRAVEAVRPETMMLEGVAIPLWVVVGVGLLSGAVAEKLSKKVDWITSGIGIILLAAGFVREDLGMAEAGFGLLVSHWAARGVLGGLRKVHEPREMTEVFRPKGRID